jgi:hypothetical protein
MQLIIRFSFLYTLKKDLFVCYVALSFLAFELLDSISFYAPHLAFVLIDIQKSIIIHQLDKPIREKSI